MLQIIPAILATSEEEYRQKLTLVETNAQLQCGWVQIDFMDNKFVQNKSVGVEVLAKYPTRLQVEAQLMVEYPDNWIDSLVASGVARIVFPVESEGVQDRIMQIRAMGQEVGLSINPETPVSTLEPFLSTVFTVLVMSVNPGFGGQEFMPDAVDKVRAIKQMEIPVKIGVDGGISETVVKQLAGAGADYLVIGAHLLDGDIDENLKKINWALFA